MLVTTVMCQTLITNSIQTVYTCIPTKTSSLHVILYKVHEYNYTKLIICLLSKHVGT